MIPLLSSPLALLGLVAVPALAAIYLLRNRFRRHPVSSLILWQRQLHAKEGGRRVQRFQTLLPFILELIILVLLVIAAVDPLWRSRHVRPLVVVLDDSASMSAGKTVTPRKQALRALLGEIEAGGFYPVRFVLAGATPELLSAGTRPEEAEILPLLQANWTCLSPGAGIGAAIGMAGDVSGELSAILVVTDHAPPAIMDNGRIKWRSFGRPEPNAGFVNASRVRLDNRDRCLLEVENMSRDSVRTILTVNAGSPDGPESTVLNLGPHERTRKILELSSDAPELHASLSGDALSIDNEVSLLPCPPRRVKIRVDTRDKELNKLLHLALDASGMRSSVRGRPELLFTDLPVPRSVGTGTWVVRFVGTGNAKTYIGPFVVDTAHPVAEGIGFNGVAWGAAGTNNFGGMPVVMAGNIALITDVEDLLGDHTLYVRFDPEVSNVQDTPAWPSLIWNLMAWRTDELPGLKSTNCRLDDEVVYVADRSTKAVFVTAPDGSESEHEVRERRVHVHCTEPGVYKLEVGDLTYAFAANFLVAEESDISKCESGTWGDWKTPESLRKDYASFSWVFLLLALLILCAHLALIAGRGNRLSQ